MSALRHIRPPLPLLAMLFVAPILLGLVGGGVPWPGGMVWVTGPLCVAFAMAAHRVLRSASAKGRRVTWRLGLAGTLAFIAVYLLLFSRFTFTIPTTDEVIVTGYACTPSAQAVFGERCAEDVRETLAQAQYEPGLIWTQGSIDVVRVSLALSWLAFFVSMSVAMASVSEGAFGDLIDKAPAPYEGSGSFYFVSYAHADLARINPFTDKLVQAGHRLWFDKGIEAGEEWDKTLSTKLRACSGLLLFLSGNSQQAKWVIREVMFADDLDKPVCCVRLEPGPLSPPLDVVLARTQIIDVADGSALERVGRFMARYSA